MLAKHAKAEAERTLRYGYFHKLDTGFSYAFCPCCRTQINGPHPAWVKAPAQRVAAVRKALIAHLREEH